jgi:NAD(P)-dependent dehydrogenase (short-subunit alcohol dehydrogenase family)
VQEAFDHAGRIDVVVSNAGYGLVGAAEELTDAQIARQIATNLLGPIQLIRAVLPYLRAQGGGRILQVSSEGGQIAYPNFSLYHTTKWGIEGFVESVAKEVAPFGIDFVLVEPGPTVTNFRQGAVRAEPMTVYDNTPAGDVRRAIASGTFVLKGDATKTVKAMIDAADADKPALRLALGSTAFASISKALAERLAAIESQKQVALSADRDDLPQQAS